jgi:large subunit ribosomal protein L3
VPGSIGSNTDPARVVKGRKLPGHMGFHKTTVKNLRILDVRPEMDVIAVEGGIPGSRNSIVEISKSS